jgi:hypothetical protein
LTSRSFVLVQYVAICNWFGSVRMIVH